MKTSNLTNLIIALLLLSIYGCGVKAKNKQNKTNEFRGKVTFKSSDKKLEKTFEWAKEKALSYSHASGDKVGPWYEAALPNRQAFCMRDVSHQTQAAEILGLSAENYNMMHLFVNNISESKDYCSWWEIDKDGKPAPVDYENDKEFWYNLNANFDIIDACNRLYEWTGDESYIKQKEFVNFFEVSLNQYIERWRLAPEDIMSRPVYMNSPSPFDKNKSFHTCRGLPSYVENKAGITMSADLIAMLYKGFVAYAEIKEKQGLDSKKYRETAEKYRQILEEKWWNENKQHYETLYTENDEYHLGEGETFILWYDIANNPQRVTATLENLFKEEFNVENRSYFPVLYSKYGFNQKAYEELIAVGDPKTERRDYPEVSFGIVDGTITGLMGIKVDASSNVIETCHKHPKEETIMHVNQLPTFSQSIEVEHKGNSKTIFKNKGNNSITWKGKFKGSHEQLYKNGEEQDVIYEEDLLGNKYTYILQDIKPGEKVIISTSSTQI